MCGICGWFGPAQAAGPELTAAMTVPLQHRGPDDLGIEGGDGWSLGFRRLSILDLSPLGHQPMRSPDGSCWLAFNGEIYNYLELRRELERAGEAFQSGSDTEVLLRLLMRLGAGALPLLNGMFALAFVDTKRRSFLLARDRLGVKPLYYSDQDGHLRFASELKGLLACPDAPGRSTVPRWRSTWRSATCRAKPAFSRDTGSCRRAMSLQARSTGPMRRRRHHTGT